MHSIRRLGKTDIEAPAIGLGTWQFSGGKGLVGRFWEAIPQSTINEIVEASLKGGIRLFDTAEAYGDGESERRLSAALQQAGKKPGEITIATKWNPAFRRAGSIAATIDDRLGCLRPYDIDLFQVHQPYGLSSVESEMDAMADLVASKKIRFVGVSNFNVPRMRRAHQALARRGLVLASNQMRYSLLDRAIEQNGVMACAKELGIAIIAFSPLEQGLLTGRFHEAAHVNRTLSGARRLLPAFWARNLERTRPLIDTLAKVARAHGVEVSQVALAWLIQFHGDTVFAIPGASRRSQAEANARVLALDLTAAELSAIDEVSRRLGANRSSRLTPATPIPSSA